MRDMRIQQIQAESAGYIHKTRWLARFPLLFVSLLALFFASCGTLTGGNTTVPTTPTPEPVNVFGSSLNHVHSLLALPGNVLVLATHYGLFRSQDDGKSWQMVAAGPGQIMSGRMTTSMVSSPINQQRLYVVTLIAVSGAKGTLGLYTSADQGRTWKLSISTDSLGSIDFVTPGNDTPDEVYAYLPSLGALGLKVSMDDGAHFTTTGTLPFGRILGLSAVPGVQGQLLAYGNDGLARSTDGGLHWQVVPGIDGAILDATTIGPNKPIYAAGDAGVYSSNDGGKSFTLVYAKNPYFFLTASPAQPQILYGKTGTVIARSTDGGHSWTPLPHIAGNLQTLATDPDNPSWLYLALSYPSAVYRYDANSPAWVSLTPKS